MGIFEGILKGFTGASQTHQARQFETAQRQTDLEQRIFSTLLGSDDPEVQSIAVHGMTSSAAGKGKKSKGFLDAMFGSGAKPSPELAGLMAKLSGRSGAPGAAPAAQPTTNFVEGKAGPQGANTPAANVYGGETTAVAGGSTPAPLFKNPYQQRSEAQATDRATMIQELQGRGASEGAINQAVYGVSSQAERPMTMKPDEILVDAQGNELYRGPMANAQAPKYRTVSPGAAVWDETSGRVVYQAPRADTTPRDRPEYLDASAALRVIQDQIKIQFPLALSQERDEIRRIEDDLARQYGYGSFQELQRQAAFRRGTPPSVLGSEPPGPATVMGNPSADQQRMQVIVDKLRAGEELTPEDTAFAQMYQKAYSRER